MTSLFVFGLVALFIQIWIEFDKMWTDNFTPYSKPKQTLSELFVLASESRLKDSNSHSIMSLVEEEENTRQGHWYGYCFVFASISIIVTGWQEGHACMCSAKSHCTIHQRFSLRTGGRHDGNQQTRLSAKTDVKQ